MAGRGTSSVGFKLANVLRERVAAGKYKQRFPTENELIAEFGMSRYAVRSAITEAEKIGYKLMILPGLLSRTVVGACDAALRDLKAQGRHPTPASDITPQQGFRMNGADEWDRYRTQFREPAKQAAE
jgi:hypothetical protein